MTTTSPIAQVNLGGAESVAMFDRAVKVFPGGVPVGTSASRPSQVYIERAEGCYLYDLDGRRIVDFVNSMHALPLGHAYGPVVEELREQVGRGLSFGLGNRLAVEFGEMVCARFPSIERLRLVTSGTEATMFAMRLARAFTGRDRILRMRGSYHGTHEAVCIGESERAPLPMPGTAGDTATGWGVPRSLLDSAVFADFNDLDGARTAFDTYPDEMAGIILEPFLGGAGHIDPHPGYLEGLRKLCDDNGAVLIFDEMVSAGAGPTGAQGLFTITPDLTTTGKAVAGGMPAALVGGRQDIMAMSEARGANAPVFITSTFGGHPVAMAAGIATQRHMSDEVYARMWSLGDYLRAGLRDVVARRGVPVQVNGNRHIFSIHVSADPVLTYGQAMKAGETPSRHRLSQSLMRQGFNVPVGRGSVSAAHTTAVLDECIAAFDTAITEVSQDGF